MFGNECVPCTDKGIAGSSPEKLQVISKEIFTGFTTFLASLKPYGDMPKEMVWDKFAYIGKDKYEMKIERRDH